MISLVWKYIKQQKKRTILTIIGVVLATALVASVGLFFTSFQGMMVKEAAVNSGIQDYALVSFGGENPLTREDAQKIADNYLVERSALAAVNQQFCWEVSGEQKQLGLEEREPEAIQMKDYQMVEGRLPQNSGEVMISSEDRGGIQVGDRLSGKVKFYTFQPAQDGEQQVEMEAGQVEYTVVGVYASDSGFGLVSGGISDQIQHNSYMLLVNIKNGMNKQQAMNTILADSGVKINSEMNSDYLQWQGQRGTNAVQMAINGTFLLLSAIILFAMATVIRNSFAMSVSEKMSQFGALRCVGASPSQIRRMVFQEALLIWIIALPIGLLLGMAAMTVVFGIVQNIDLHALRYLNLVMSPLPFLLTALFSFAAVILSARSPAARAAKISAIEAVRGASIFEDAQTGNGRGGAILGKLGGISGQLAGKNIRRNKKRYRTTVLSVTLSIAVVICIGGFGQSVIHSTLDYSEVDAFDFRITDEGADRDVQVQRLQALDTVLMRNSGLEKSTLFQQTAIRLFVPEEKMTPDYLGSLYPDSLQMREEKENLPESTAKGESLYAYAYLINRKAYEELELLPGAPSYDELIASQGVALRQNLTFSSMDSGMKQIQVAEYQVGDSVDIDLEYLGMGSEDHVDVHNIGRSFPVSALVEETPWFSGNKQQMAIYFPIENADLLFRYQDWDLPGINTRLSLKARPESVEQMSSFVAEQVSTMDQMRLMNNYEDSKERRNTAVVMSIFIYGFQVVIALICSLNLFNTINANLQARKREIAMLRAVGMENRQLWKMLLLECVMYGIIGTIWGSIVGLLLQVSLLRTLSGAMSVGMISPVFYIVGSLVVSIGVCLLAGAGPIRRIIRKPIVEEIRAQE